MRDLLAPFLTGIALLVGGYVCLALSKAAKWIALPGNLSGIDHLGPVLSRFFLAFSLVGLISGTFVLVLSAGVLAYAYVTGQAPSQVKLSF